jgi:hypothetical protein
MSIKVKWTMEGHDITQVVSRQFPIIMARVQARSGHEGFVVDKVTLRAGFLRVF